MKKNNYFLGAIVLIGALVTLGELKAPLYVSPYRKVHSTLIDDAIANGKFKRNGATWKDYSNLFANPAHYLTTAQLEVYNAAMAQVKREIEEQEAWENAQIASNFIASFPNYSTQCDELENQFPFLKTDSNWEKIREFLEDHAGKPYKKSYHDQEEINRAVNAILSAHRKDLATRKIEFRPFCVQLLQQDLNFNFEGWRFDK